MILEKTFLQMLLILLMPFSWFFVFFVGKDGFGYLYLAVSVIVL